MTIRTADADVLERLGLDHTVQAEGAFLAVVVTGFPTPAGLTPVASDLLIRLPPGFPDAGPDMFWLSPGVTTAAGGVIPGTEQTENYLGRQWQRWSRHIGGQWRPGIDNLDTYLAYIRRCLAQAAQPIP